MIIVAKSLVRSIWDVEHWRKGTLLSLTRDHNVCMDEGLTKLLNVNFHGATAITPWYVLLFGTDTTPTGATTYAVPVFTENEDYDEATRQEYVEAEAAAKSMTNSANKAVFTMNAAANIFGGALVGGGTAASTKGDTAGGGTMFCAAKFSAPRLTTSGDILRITVTLQGASG